jgi:hypothetical protein
MGGRSRLLGTLLAVMLLALAALTPWPADASPEPTPIVVGIVLRETGGDFAVIQDPVTSKPGFYTVGARVGSAVVARILADRVILVSGEQQTQLRLATPVSSWPGSAPGSAIASRDEAAGGRRPAGSSSAAADAPPSPYSNIATVTAGPGVAAGGTGTSSSGGSGGLSGGVGQPGGPSAGSEGTQNGLSAAVTLTGKLHNGGSVPGEQFSATSLRDLLITLTYSGITGSHQQRVELYAPDGSLYRKLTGAVAPTTQTLLPVGGTWITDHSLFGDWRIDVFVDRETTPIVSQAFTLTP